MHEPVEGPSSPDTLLDVTCTTTAEFDSLPNINNVFGGLDPSNDQESRTEFNITTSHQPDLISLPVSTLLNSEDAREDLSTLDDPACFDDLNFSFNDEAGHNEPDGPSEPNESDELDQSVRILGPIGHIRNELERIRISEIEVVNETWLITAVPGRTTAGISTSTTKTARVRRRLKWNVNSRASHSSVDALWSQVLDQQLPFFSEAVNVEPLANFGDTITIIQGIYRVFGFKATFSSTGELLPGLITKQVSSGTQNSSHFPMALIKTGTQLQRRCSTANIIELVICLSHAASLGLLSVHTSRFNTARSKESLISATRF